MPDPPPSLPKSRPSQRKTSESTSAHVARKTTCSSHCPAFTLRPCITSNNPERSGLNRMSSGLCSTAGYCDCVRDSGVVPLSDSPCGKTFSCRSHLLYELGLNCMSLLSYRMCTLCCLFSRSFPARQKNLPLMPTVCIHRHVQPSTRAHM